MPQPDPNIKFYRADDSSAKAPQRTDTAEPHVNYAHINENYHNSTLTSKFFIPVVVALRATDVNLHALQSSNRVNVPSLVDGLDYDFTIGNSFHDD